MQSFLACFTLSFKITNYLAHFLIAKPFNMINDNFSFSKLWIVKLFLKTDVLSLVLKALNFEDEISIKKGECNTPIKTNLFIKQNLFHKSHQQRF
jgi:hypothetical protein